MIFKIQIFVTSCFDRMKQEKRRGLALLREYDRLKWPEEHRDNEFGRFGLSVTVPTNIAIKYPRHFENKDTVIATVDSYYTQAENWEHWGPHGMFLKSITLSSDAMTNILEQEKSLTLTPPSRANMSISND